MPKKNNKYGKHDKNYKKIESVKTTKSKKSSLKDTTKTQTSKPTREVKKKESNNKTSQGASYKKLTIYVLAIFGIIALVSAAMVLIGPQDEHIVPFGHTDEGELIVSVNDEGLYSKEIEKRLGMYQAQFGPTFTREKAINETIKEMLLIQEAKKEGVQVNQGEIDSKISEWMTDLKQVVPQQQIERLLAEENMTIDEYTDELRKSVKVRLLITGLLEKTALSETESEYYEEEIDEAELEEEFQNNKENYQQVKASHILICYEDSANCQETRSKDEAYGLASEINERVVQGESFEELAREYSGCPSGSEGGNLGWFKKGQMVEEFSNAAFELRKNQFSEPVHTEFGYHIIKKTDEKKTFDELKEDIKAQVEQERKHEWEEEIFAREHEAVEKYVNKLWEESDIVFYDEKEEGSIY